jgi:carbon storage regulator
MLVLTRGIDEEIAIGDKIKLRVLSIEHNKVYLRIDAPRNVTVHRGELAVKVKERAE